MCGRNPSCPLGEGALYWPTAGVRGCLTRTETWNMGCRGGSIIPEAHLSLLFSPAINCCWGWVFKTRQDFYFFMFCSISIH